MSKSSSIPKSFNLAVVLRYLLYATAFVPLIIFADFMSPFHFGKVVVFRTLIEIAAALYLILIWRDRSYLPKFNGIFWTFLFFALAFSVVTLTSIQPYQSFWGTLERMGGLWTFWHYFIFFVVLTSVLKTKKEWFTFLEISIFVGVLAAFYGFAQKTDIKFFVGSGNRARIFGTIGNAALFAGYQIVNLFLALTLFFKPENSKNRKMFFGLSFSIMAIAVIMTAVRGSILGLGIGLLLFVLLYAVTFRSKLAKKVVFGFIAAAVIFIGASFLFKNSSFVQNSSYLRRVTDFSFTAYTVQTRFWAWRAGINGWNDSAKTIVFGWGPENFNIPFSKYFNPKFFAGLGSETLFDRAHNMFVEILVTMGLLGLISYLSIFAALFKELGKKIKERSTDAIYGVGFISLVIAYMIHNSFIFDTSANFVIFFSVVGFISFLSLSKREEKEIIVKPINTLQRTVAITLLILAGLLIYKTDILPAKANYTTTRAIILGWNNDFVGAVKKYNEALRYDVAGKYEIRHRFAQYVLEYASANKSTSEIVDALKQAIFVVQKNADENPHDYLPELYLSRLNIILGRSDYNSPYNDEALKHSLKALDISPTFIRTYYEVAQAYLNKKNNDKAIEYFKKAAELNPAVGLSYWYWGAVELEQGNVDLGLKLVSEAFKKGYSGSENDYLKVVNFYLKRNDFNNIAILYEKLIGSRPDNAQYHASLAVAYAKIGKIDDAVRQAREAAKIDSNFEAEARSFVQSLGRVF